MLHEVSVSDYRVRRGVGRARVCLKLGGDLAMFIDVKVGGGNVEYLPQAWVPQQSGRQVFDSAILASLALWQKEFGSQRRTPAA